MSDDDTKASAKDEKTTMDTKTTEGEMVNSDSELINTKKYYESTEKEHLNDDKNDLDKHTEEVRQKITEKASLLSKEISLKDPEDKTNGVPPPVENLSLEKEPIASDEFLPDGENEEHSPGPPLLPPDGGWGWLVAIGAFILSTLLPSIGPAFGILFNEFLAEKEASSATIGWIFNMQMFVWNVMGPLVNPLTTEFGWRRIGFFGVVLVWMSMITSAFSPSTGFLFFSFSFLGGMGGGLALTMCLMIVPQYFYQRRGLANTFLMTGICMSQIAGAPLARYLLDEYGFKCGTLIFGTILLNGLAAVAVFHPLKWHMKKRTDQSATDPSSGMTLKPEINVVAKPSKEKKIKNDKKVKSVNKNETNGGMRKIGELIIRVVKASASDFKVVKMYRAIIICCGIAFSIIGYGNFIMVIPFAMRAADFSLEDASRLISMLGMSNMVTRLIISPLTDWKRFNMRLCIMTGYAMVSACMFVFPFLHTMEWMMVDVVIMGCGIGTNMSLFTLVMIKYLGIEHLSSTVGVTNLVVGVGAMAFGPFIGYVRDVTGSFAVSIWIMAALLAGSFTMWLFMPAAIRADLAKANANKNSV